MTSFQKSSIGHATGFHIYCPFANSKEAMLTSYLTRKGSIPGRKQHSQIKVAL
jgi:hypothetical protein